MNLWHYIHHIIFDPLSAWEKIGADLFWFAATIVFMFTLWVFVMGCIFVGLIWHRITKG